MFFLLVKHSPARGKRSNTPCGTRSPPPNGVGGASGQARLKINNEGTEMINGNAPHALYRFFATDGSLLYVGVTNNPARRFTQHGVQRDWWHEVATIRMERHESREAVLAAEKAAIAKERPRYNVKHNGGAPVTGETPERGTPGDYPVNAGEVVALAIAPNHAAGGGYPVRAHDDRASPGGGAGVEVFSPRTATA